jgi:hypothetical protein
LFWEVHRDLEENCPPNTITASQGQFSENFLPRCCSFDAGIQFNVKRPSWEIRKKEEGAGMKGMLPPPTDAPDRLGESPGTLAEAVVGGRASACLLKKQLFLIPNNYYHHTALYV